MSRNVSSSFSDLWQLGEDCIRELETEDGLLASARSELYGCVFGRDSLLSSTSLLRVYKTTRNPYYASVVRKVLLTQARLQGQTENIESGEEPGKCIHEFRTSSHEHLTAREREPWYMYDDGTMRNYDSVDATPLFLIATHRYLAETDDREFASIIMPHVHAALRWITEFGDKNNDGFVDYSFHSDRQGGGLRVQSWMDSTESLFFEHNGDMPAYPIAPVEVQAYVYHALSLWSEYFKTENPELASQLRARAVALKAHFNNRFVRSVRKRVNVAFAIDGRGETLLSPRSSIAHCLWAVSPVEGAQFPDGILEDEYVEGVVARLLSRDLFVPRAGIRTLSSRSLKFDPTSYHNGSIWPHDTAMCAEGFENFGFFEEARRVREGAISAWSHFTTPIELFGYKRGTYCEYQGVDGQKACRRQAWSAASLLATLSHQGEK